MRTLSSVVMAVVVLAVLVHHLVVAQGTPRSTAFEVASIRPSTQLAQALRDGSLIGMQIGVGRVSIGHVPLSKLIEWAYGVKHSQIEGPDWLLEPPDVDDFSHPFVAKDYELFDVEAVLPSGAGQDQVPEMLRGLLRDRFHLEVHPGTRRLDVYALTVAKGRPPIARLAERPEQGQALPTGSAIATDGKTITINGARTTILPDRSMTVATSGMVALADYLSLQLALPVIDRTELKGPYEIRLNVTPAEGGPAMEQEDRLMVAVERLGLKLTREKNVIRTIIVDSAERIPTGN